MGEGLGKYIGGKVLTAVLAVAAVIVIVWYVRLEPSDREAMWGGVRTVLVWLGLVAVLPWALFFMPAMVLRRESNLASALMLAAYLLVDFGFAYYLAGGIPDGGWQRAFLILGLLCAAVYNLVACEFLAQKAEDSA